MFENIASHMDTMAIIFTVVAGLWKLDSRMEAKIDKSEERLTEKIENNRKEIEVNRSDVKNLDSKVNDLSNKASHIEGRLDQLFPPGVDRNAA